MKDSRRLDKFYTRGGLITLELLGGTIAGSVVGAAISNADSKYALAGALIGLAVGGSISLAREAISEYRTRRRPYD
ncbi:MAG TPA: hypothetical protein VJB06_02165 [archaeon]|nr:hypothetical protein [archaeon]